MGTRSVRLDAESERILEDFRRATGLSASEALKRGLRALRDDMSRRVTCKPYEIYESLDLGPGGYASTPSSEAKATARRAIQRKHGR